MNSELALFAKGVAMGAANVIPGVSGGTIALLTGIYQRLINALKGFGPTALGLLLKRELRAFWTHVDGRWLCILLGGVALSILTLARLFEYLLEEHERLTMAFFFGLILLSIVFVAQRISRWSIITIAAVLIGIGVAVSIALLAPASENDSFLYVFICGVIAISSMILPGLSGSFILILLGNYALVLGAISSLDFAILIPLALGCGFGLIAFSHFLAWVFDRYADATLALMTGFVIGSLVIIWPWKEAVTETLERAGKPPKDVIVSYDWFLPSLQSVDTWVASGLMILGMVTVALMEYLARRQ